MPLVKKIVRGLQDIKTISGRVDLGSVPYKAYMKLSVLEMEKYRRGKEKASALERIRNIENRFKDIERERQEIMNNLENVNSAGGTGMHNELHTRSFRHSTGAFKIRY